MAGHKPKGMMRGGKMTSKMSTKGGAMGGKKRWSDMIYVKNVIGLDQASHNVKSVCA